MSSPNPSLYGQTVTMSATVTASDGAMLNGSVEFFNGAAAIASVPVNGGAAVLNYAGLPPGTDNLTAMYLGTPGYGSSVSTAVAQSVSLPDTSTLLAVSPTASTYGQSVTMTATVTAANGQTPTGTVQFFNGATGITGVNLNSSGVATLNYSKLPVGTDSLTAKYLGNGDYSGSKSATVGAVVSAASTTTALTTSPNPSTARAKR
jgi:trimeric autotransporter adhesin